MSKESKLTLTPTGQGSCIWRITGYQDDPKRTRYRLIIDGPPKLGENGEPKRNQIVRTYNRKRDAEAERDRIRTQVRTGSYVEVDRKTTLAQACTAWLDGRRSIRPTTRRVYGANLEHVRQHWIGALPVASIGKEHVDALVNDMVSGGARLIGTKGKPLGPLMIHHVIGTLSQVFTDLCRQGRLPRNPAEYVDLPELPEEVDRGWSGQQAVEFLVSIRDHRLYAPYLVSLCGLRRGEVLRLTWADLDLDAEIPTATVRISKTKSGIRVAALAPSVGAALRRYRRMLAEERLAAGEAYQVTDRVVVDELGQPIGEAAYSEQFKRLVRDAGAPPIVLHGLRHTCATIMDEQQDVPIKYAAMQLGHSRKSLAGPAMTLRYQNEVRLDVWHPVVGKALERGLFPSPGLSVMSR